MNIIEKLKNRINEIDNSKLDKKQKSKEYDYLSKILYAIEKFIRFRLTIDDETEETFKEFKENNLNENYLEEVAILIECYETLKGPLPDFIDRNELYDYINSESSKKIKK